MSADTIPTDAEIQTCGYPHDLPCPRCDYNLKGLLVPRCPECGLTISWESARSAVKVKEQIAKERRTGAILGFSLIGLIGIFALLGEMGARIAIMLFGSFFIVALIAFPLSAIQALLEISLLYPVLGFGGMKRFRAWWEGVLITYGACGFASMAFRPRSIIQFGRLEWDSMEFVLRALFIPIVLSTAIQLAVLWQRNKRWNLGLQSPRLIPALLGVKTLFAVIWILMIEYWLSS